MSWSSKCLTANCPNKPARNRSRCDGCNSGNLNSRPQKKSDDRAFRTGWSVVKAPFEDHAWAQGNPYAEEQYNKLVSGGSMEGADEAYSNPDVMDLIDTVKQMIQAAETGLSGESTRNAYGAYLRIIPELGERMGGMGAAVHMLLMAGANPQGVMDAVKILRGGR